MGEIGALMAFAWNVGQSLEGVHPFALNPVGNCQPRLSEQVTPNLLEIVFGFWRNAIGFHDSG